MTFLYAVAGGITLVIIWLLMDKYLLHNVHDTIAYAFAFVAYVLGYLQGTRTIQ